MRLRLISLLALGLAAACNQSGLPPESPGENILAEFLVASAGPDGVSLENRGTSPVRFSVIDSLFFENGLASWCLGQDDCGASLAAGERRVIPAEDIVGPPPRDKAVQVLWWDLRPGTPEEKSGRFERIYLRLP